MSSSTSFYLFSDFFLNFITPVYSPIDAELQYGQNYYQYPVQEEDQFALLPQIPPRQYPPRKPYCGSVIYFKNLFADIMNIKLIFYGNCCIPGNMLNLSDKDRRELCEMRTEFKLMILLLFLWLFYFALKKIYNFIRFLYNIAQRGRAAPVDADSDNSDNSDDSFHAADGGDTHETNNNDNDASDTNGDSSDGDGGRGGRARGGRGSFGRSGRGRSVRGLRDVRGGRGNIFKGGRGRNYTMADVFSGNEPDNEGTNASRSPPGSSFYRNPLVPTQPSQVSTDTQDRPPVPAENDESNKESSSSPASTYEDVKGDAPWMSPENSNYNRRTSISKKGKKPAKPNLNSQDPYTSSEESPPLSEPFEHINTPPRTRSSSDFYIKSSSPSEPSEPSEPEPEPTVTVLGGLDLESELNEATHGESVFGPGGNETTIRTLGSGNLDLNFDENTFAAPAFLPRNSAARQRASEIPNESTLVRRTTNTFSLVDLAAPGLSSLGTQPTATANLPAEEPRLSQSVTDSSFVDLSAQLEDPPTDVSPEIIPTTVELILPTYSSMGPQTQTSENQSSSDTSFESISLSGSGSRSSSDVGPLRRDLWDRITTNENLPDPNQPSENESPSRSDSGSLIVEAPIDITPLGIHIPQGVLPIPENRPASESLPVAESLPATGNLNTQLRTAMNENIFVEPRPSAGNVQNEPPVTTATLYVPHGDTEHLDAQLRTAATENQYDGPLPSAGNVQNNPPVTTVTLYVPHGDTEHLDSQLHTAATENPYDAPLPSADNVQNEPPVTTATLYVPHGDTEHLDSQLHTAATEIQYDGPLPSAGNVQNEPPVTTVTLHVPHGYTEHLDSQLHTAATENPYDAPLPSAGTLRNEPPVTTATLYVPHGDTEHLDSQLHTAATENPYDAPLPSAGTLRNDPPVTTGNVHVPHGDTQSLDAQLYTAATENPYDGPLPSAGNVQNDPPVTTVTLHVPHGDTGSLSTQLYTAATEIQYDGPLPSAGNVQNNPPVTAVTLHVPHGDTGSLNTQLRTAATEIQYNAPLPSAGNVQDATPASTDSENESYSGRPFPFHSPESVENLLARYNTTNTNTTNPGYEPPVSNDSYHSPDYTGNVSSAPDSTNNLHRSPASTGNASNSSVFSDISENSFDNEIQTYGRPRGTSVFSRNVNDQARTYAPRNLSDAPLIETESVDNESTPTSNLNNEPMPTGNLNISLAATEEMDVTLTSIDNSYSDPTVNLYSAPLTSTGYVSNEPTSTGDSNNDLASSVALFAAPVNTEDMDVTYASTSNSNNVPIFTGNMGVESTFAGNLDAPHDVTDNLQVTPHAPTDNSHHSPAVTENATNASAFTGNASNSPASSDNLAHSTSFSDESFLNDIGVRERPSRASAATRNSNDQSSIFTSVNLGNAPPTSTGNTYNEPTSIGNLNVPPTPTENQYYAPTSTGDSRNVPASTGNVFNAPTFTGNVFDAPTSDFDTYNAHALTHGSHAQPNIVENYFQNPRTVATENSDDELPASTEIMNEQRTTTDVQNYHEPSTAPTERLFPPHPSILDLFDHLNAKNNESSHDSTADENANDPEILPEAERPTLADPEILPDAENQVAEDTSLHPSTSTSSFVESTARENPSPEARVSPSSISPSYSVEGSNPSSSGSSSTSSTRRRARTISNPFNVPLESEPENDEGGEHIVHSTKRTRLSPK